MNRNREPELLWGSLKTPSKLTYSRDALESIPGENKDIEFRWRIPDGVLSGVLFHTFQAAIEAHGFTDYQDYFQASGIDQIPMIYDSFYLNSFCYTPLRHSNMNDEGEAVLSYRSPIGEDTYFIIYKNCDENNRVYFTHELLTGNPGCDVLGEFETFQNALIYLRDGLEKAKKILEEKYPEAFQLCEPHDKNAFIRQMVCGECGNTSRFFKQVVESKKYSVIIKNGVMTYDNDEIDEEPKFVKGEGIYCRDCYESKREMVRVNPICDHIPDKFVD